MRLPANRTLYLPDVIGAHLSINGNKLIAIYIPFETSIEQTRKNISVDDILIAIRDAFGAQAVDLDKKGRFEFGLYQKRRKAPQTQASL